MCMFCLRTSDDKAYCKTCMMSLSTCYFIALLVTFTKSHTWMWLPNIKNSPFSVALFHPITHPLKKHPILPWLSFYLKYTFCNLGFFICDRNSPINIPPFAKKSSQKAGPLFVYHVNETPQIYTRDTRLLIRPRVLESSSIGLNSGVFGFLPTTRKNNRKTNALTIFARRAASNAWLSSRSDRSTCKLLTHLGNHDYFDYGKNQETPNWAPCQD